MSKQVLDWRGRWWNGADFDIACASASSAGDAQAMLDSAWCIKYSLPTDEYTDTHMVFGGGDASEDKQ